MKKIALALFLAICCGMFTGCAPEPAPQPAAVYESGDYKYILLADGTAEIVDYADTTDVLIIPRELDGHPVTSIGDRAFSYCYGLTHITIPDSVTTIGDYAFYYCYSLPEVTVPDGVTSIGDYAFSYCTSMVEISIADSVTSVGANPFSACDSLMQITVSPGHPVLETVDGVLFDRVEKRLVCYPYAFTEDSYRVPEGTLSIGDGAFYWCSSLAEITMPGGVTSIGDEAFYRCFSLAEFLIPDSVASIGSRAFFGCRSLTEIAIPDSVASVGTNPFASCDNLTRIAVSPQNPVLEAVDGVLFDRTEKRLVCYPCAFEESAYSIPEGTLVIGDWAFSGCGFLTEVAIPDGVTSIGAHAFDSCASLNGIALPDSVVSIGTHAFSSCAALVEAVVPAKVLFIGEDAFYRSDALTLVVERDSCAERYAEENGIPFIHTAG